MDQCEAVGAFVLAGHDEAGDLDHLPMTTSRGLRVLTRRLEMVLGCGRVSGDARQHGEQGVVDRVHAATMRRRAYSTLTHG